MVENLIATFLGSLSPVRMTAMRVTSTVEVVFLLERYGDVEEKQGGVRDKGSAGW